MKDVAGPPGAGRARIVGLVAVLLLAIAPYLRTLSYGFVYDDHLHIRRNAFVQDPRNLVELLPWRILAHEVPDQGRPTLLATLLVDRAIGGGSPAPYHATSVLLHALAAALVMRLALRLGLAVPAAAAAGILFAIHPAHAETVACVSNREDVLATALVLGSLLAFGRAFASSRAAWLALAAVLFGLALGAKEVAIVTPLLLGLLAACSAEWRPRGPRRRALAVATVAVVLGVGAAWGTFQSRLGYPSVLPAAGGSGLELEARPVRAIPELTVVAAGVPDADGAVTRRSPSVLGLGSTIAVEAFRAWQLVVPWPLSAEYDLEPFRRPWAPLAGAALLAALAIAAWAARRRAPPLTLAVGWFAIATVPVSVPGLLLNPLADRYLYLPAVGACVAGAWSLLVWLPARWDRARGRAAAPSAAAPRAAGPRAAAPGAGAVAPAAPWVGWIALALASSALVQVGVRRIDVWRDDLTLFTDAARRAPRSARVRLNLGAARMRAGDLEGARLELERALALDSSLLAARLDLGLLEERRRRPEAALAAYREGLARPTARGERALRERVLGRAGALLLRADRLEELDALLRAEAGRAPEPSATARRLAGDLERARRGR